MTEKEEASVSETVIKRRRRRLYEPLPPESSDSHGTSEEANTAFSEASAKKPAEQEPGIFSHEEPGEVNTFAEKSLKKYADEIVKDHMVWTAGIAFIPLPMVDMIAVTAIEMRMLKKLSDLYEAEFSEHKVKSAIASLTGGLHAGLLAGKLSMLIPVVGLGIAAASTGVIAGAITYAVGKVFVKHFETGGTFLDFDPSKVKTYFAEKYKEGRKVASKANA
ncbi:DUF697 domain-containing protein [Desulfococcaceae bacterium HSG8]|nr:DUF697 domain-containing protein [Desulfococcaceae bacterium HSG8]